MKSVLLPIAVVLAVGASAAAAHAATSPWNGAYVGVNLGGFDAKTRITIPLYPSAYDTSKVGVLGGGQAGYNILVAPDWVVGVEGDLDGLGVTDTSIIPNSPVVGEQFKVRYNLAYSVRGRVGYAPGPWLIYGTGGWAGARLDDSQYIPLAGGHHSASLSGWAAGGGVEYATASHWTVGAEWIHSDYGRKSFVFNGPTSIKLQAETFRARLSYRFP